MSILFWLSCLLVVLSIGLCFIRMALGPTLPDRVVALDLLTNLLMASIALFSIYSRKAVYLDIIVALALVMFLTSTMYAYFLEKQNNKGARKDDQ